MKRMLRKVMVLVLVLALLGTSATVLATYESVTVDLGENFEPMTREEFLTRKARAEGITYKEAAQIVDAEIEEAIAALPPIPTPLGWTGDTTIDNGDSTYTIYGRVYDYNNHPSGMSAYFYADAVKLYHHYGSQFVSVGSTGAMASGTGQYYLTSGSGASAQIINGSSQIRLAFTGIYEVAEDVAVSLGLNFQFISAGATIGGTTYYRTSVVTDTHIETA